MKKLERLRAKMHDLELDGVVVYNELNQRYLSDFAFSDGALFITGENAYLITDFRYFEMAKTRADSAFEVIMPEKRREKIIELARLSECRRIGIEGDFLPYSTYEKLKENFSFAEVVNISDMIEDLRKLKDAEEILKIEKAQNITDLAFSQLLSVINPSKMTEIDLAAELEYIMKKNGADGFAFDTIAVSGDASALPHGTPRNEILKKGFLTLDFGAKFDGYCSDMTRTLVIGRADTEMKKIYDTVLLAQTTVLEFLRAGALASEADKLARDIINKDYNGCFGHSLGHSLGLYIHESPSLSKNNSGYRVRTGEIYTVEPGIYLYGKYGVRIEDMVKIEDTGVYNFTKSPKEMIEIL